MEPVAETSVGVTLARPTTETVPIDPVAETPVTTTSSDPKPEPAKVSAAKGEKPNILVPSG
jgi:hypothetical protein